MVISIPRISAISSCVISMTNPELEGWFIVNKVQQITKFNLRWIVFLMNRFKQESVYICMLSVCDERSLEVVKATAKALIDTAPEK